MSLPSFISPPWSSRSRCLCALPFLFFPLTSGHVAHSVTWRKWGVQPWISPYWDSDPALAQSFYRREQKGLVTCPRLQSDCTSKWRLELPHIPVTMRYNAPLSILATWITPYLWQCLCPAPSRVLGDDNASRLQEFSESPVKPLEELGTKMGYMCHLLVFLLLVLLLNYLLLLSIWL